MTAEVIFKMTETSEYTNALYSLLATHLYIGNDPLPSIGRWNTVAPGLYGNLSFHHNSTEYTYTVQGLTGQIYIIGHAVTNGFDPGTL